MRADLVGFGGRAVLIGAIARVSGTVAQNFGPERVQVQFGVLLLIPLALIVAAATRPQLRTKRVGLLALVVIELAGATVCRSSRSAACLRRSCQRRVRMSRRFTVDTSALYSAEWTIDHSGRRIVQWDPFAKLAVANFTGAARQNSVDSVDPIAVDHGA